MKDVARSPKRSPQVFPRRIPAPAPRRIVVLFAAALLLGIGMPGPHGRLHAQAPDTAKVRGLLLGSLIGDAAGAPTEFAPPQRHPFSGALTPAQRLQLARAFVIPPSTRGIEPYGPWSKRHATLTDDSRFKAILFDALAAEPLSAEAFARALLRWEARDSLNAAWLAEFAAGARWVLGDAAIGLPPERMWGGIPTMAGQMPFLPLALMASSPEEAYRLTWKVNFLDNGFGRDVTAALVAGLHQALQPGADWRTVERAMRQTDPFHFSEVPWVQRRVVRWLDVAADLAERAGGSPAVLYDLLENELQAETWWESWVPLVVVFSAARVADHDPLATLQIIQEFGHDTDSYLQLAGALVGALHGQGVFPPEMVEAVTESLEADYGVSVEEWVSIATSWDR